MTPQRYEVICKGIGAGIKHLLWGLVTGTCIFVVTGAVLVIGFDATGWGAGYELLFLTGFLLSGMVINALVGLIRRGLRVLNGIPFIYWWVVLMDRKIELEKLRGLHREYNKKQMQYLENDDDDSVDWNFERYLRRYLDNHEAGIYYLRGDFGSYAFERVNRPEDSPVIYFASGSAAVRILLSLP